jgi:hypothetical protein
MKRFVSTFGKVANKKLLKKLTCSQGSKIEEW